MKNKIVFFSAAFFKWLPNFYDLVNSNDCIRKMTPKSISYAHSKLCLLVLQRGLLIQCSILIVVTNSCQKGRTKSFCFEIINSNVTVSEIAFYFENWQRLYELISSDFAPQTSLSLQCSQKLLREFLFNPFMPTVAFNICCPRDAVSRTAIVGTVGKNILSAATLETLHRRTAVREAGVSQSIMGEQLRTPQT